ncbi:hypothetical protein VIGAN_01160000 [Vigna angularis var. angularis]|uniref:Uncharacterized protein n=1 Tax=Vigna angularis var. angularis TaxID=157739 RepID=A0A0S3R0D8_PHAAN|nr:hypothetical protein VIGAN_01160000 [Vigna angularis var. angularis]
MQGRIQARCTVVVPCTTAVAWFVFLFAGLGCTGPTWFCDTKPLDVAVAILVSQQQRRGDQEDQNKSRAKLVKVKGFLTRKDR